MLCLGFERGEDSMLSFCQNKHVEFVTNFQKNRFFTHLATQFSFQNDLKE